MNLNICINILNNACVFSEFLPFESHVPQWALVFQEIDVLYKKLAPIMNKSYDYTCIFMIMTNLLKVSSIATSKVCKTNTITIKLN